MADFRHTPTATRKQVLLRIKASAQTERAGEEIRLDRPFTVGRERTCDIVLVDGLVSRHHARIEPSDDGVRVVDLGSANGVWIGNERVQDMRVRSGGEFKIGSTVFTCDVQTLPDDAPVSTEAPTVAFIVPTMAMPVIKPAAIDADVVLTVVDASDGTEVGREFTIRGNSAILGRSPDSTIVLIERDISRKHARLDRTPEGLRLTDLGSSCGVWIGQHEVKTGIVRPGDRFRLGGRLEIEYRVAPQAGLEPVTTPDPNSPAFVSAAAARPVEPPNPDATGFVPLPAPAPPAEPVNPDATAFIALPSDGARAQAPPPADANPDATNFISREAALAAMRAATPGAAPPIAAKPARKSSPATKSPTAKAPVVPGPAGTPDAPGEAGPPPPPIVRESDFTRTSTMRIPADLLAPVAGRIEDEGELIEVSAHKPFLIDDTATVWYVVEGGILIFTVAVEKGEPVGPRTHFLGVSPGQAFFGFDLQRYGVGSGFLAVAKQGTRLRKMPMARVRALAAQKSQAAAIGALVDTWVAGLSKSLITGLVTKRTGEIALEPEQRIELDKTAKATSASGVLWIEIGSGGVVFNDMATPMFQRRTTLFPVTPHSWIQPISDEFGALLIKPVKAADAVGAADQALWHGLDVFHQVLCECEFINKKLSTVDEFIRLQQKQEHAQAAQDAAYSAIGAVMSSEGATPRELLGTADAEPIFRAATLVGDRLGMKIKEHPSSASEEGLTYEERVGAIASISGFRTRVVALRDAWYREDNGPLLAQTAETKDPVALLPASATTYECFNVKTGTREVVDARVAETLAPFAHSFYRPFPEGKLRIIDVVKFGAMNLKADARWVMGLSIVVGMFGTFTPWITGQVFDRAIPQADRGALIGFGIAMLFSALATSAFKFTQGVATVRIQSRMAGSIQSAVWDRILNLPVNFFRKYSAGDLADRADGVGAIQELVSGAGVAAILGSVSGLFYVIQMFGYNLNLALLAIVLTATYVGFNFGANYLQLRYQRVEIQLRGKISGLVLNLLTGVTKLRVCGAEHHAFRVWAEQFAAQRKISFTIGMIQNTATVFGSVFPILSSMAIFYTMISVQEAAAAGGGATLTTGDFIAFNSAYGLFMAAMQALGDASLSLLKVVPIYERLSPILDQMPEVDASKAFPGKLKGEIELSHVFFRYDPDGPWIVNDVSLKIKPGEFVAFVGSSGGGKSTIMRLMLGFEQPTRGSVLYDGQDLSSLDIRLVRQQLGVVLQTSRVMPTEMYRNIIGVSSRTIDDAWQAAEKAGLAEDIRNMPMGMHTYVSEGGGTLSGGQRQRLMIARSIVNKPKILFLDEATSALDNRAQAIVTASMDAMDSTRIVIAHRLSTVENANRICYLHGGQLAEMGTYNELMEKDGMFAALAKRQIVT